ncbi:hypothetical protein J6590_098301, partial [Homalodisca vitripennis]
MGTFDEFSNIILYRLKVMLQTYFESAHLLVLQTHLFVWRVCKLVATVLSGWVQEGTGVATPPPAPPTRN